MLACARRRGAPRRARSVLDPPRRPRGCRRGRRRRRRAWDGESWRRWGENRAPLGAARRRPRTHRASRRPTTRATVSAGDVQPVPTPVGLPGCSTAPSGLARRSTTRHRRERPPDECRAPPAAAARTRPRRRRSTRRPRGHVYRVVPPVAPRGRGRATRWHSARPDYRPQGCRRPWSRALPVGGGVTRSVCARTSQTPDAAPSHPVIRRGTAQALRTTGVTRISRASAPRSPMRTRSDAGEGASGARPTPPPRHRGPPGPDRGPPRRGRSPSRRYRSRCSSGRRPPRYSWTSVKVGLLTPSGSSPRPSARPFTNTVFPAPEVAV